MNIFDNIKRRFSNAWREASSDVIDLTEEDSEASGSSSGRHSATSSFGPAHSEPSSSSSRSSVGSSGSSPESSTPNGRSDETARRFGQLAVSPVAEMAPRPLLEISQQPKAVQKPLLPVFAPKAVSPTYTVKQENAARERAALMEKIFTKKDQLKKLERFLSNEGLINSLPDKGNKVRAQILALKLELKTLYKSLKEMGEIAPLLEPKAEPTSSRAPDFENLPLKKNYARPGDYAVAEALTGDALIQLHAALRDFPEDAFDHGPRRLEVELLMHQKKALAWALWREAKHPQGGILADDMGLGKTLTMIALILRSRELEKDNEENIAASPRGPKKAKTLVICPASVLKQWESEIINRCEPRALVPYVYHGNSRSISVNRLCRMDVVITSYAIVGREGKITQDFAPGREERPSGMLFGVRWERVILDEAHTIRNPKTQLAQGVYQLDAKFRWCLTGTPLHNNLKDIYSLFNFLKFTPFTNEMVWRRIADNKSSAGLEKLNTVMKTVMLRRTKQELQAAGQLECLPDKGVQEIALSLGPHEHKIYQHMLNKSKTLMAKFILQRAERQVETGEDIYAVRKAMEQLEQDGFSVHKGMHRQGDQVKASHILVLLLRLRQICCHTSLVKNKLDDAQMAAEHIEPTDQSFEQLVEEVNNLSLVEPEDEQRKDDSLLDPDNPVFDTDFSSTKVEATVKLVREVKERGEKVVVVSQWKSFLAIVEQHLRLAGIRSTLFSGELTTTKRQEIISDFNEPRGKIKVLLLSLTAGGTGVNLIGANNLVLIDIHWNPQLEAQAMDRIYRVGQKKDVNIYKMICQQSIESSIQMMQEKKLQLAEGVLGKNKHVKLNIEDLRLLFMNA